MVSFSQNAVAGFAGYPAKRPTLRQLHEVQEEIYRQLHLLIPDQFAFHDSLRSRVPGSPDLRMEVLERHPYTTFFRLTYEFREGEEHHYAPDAHIRFYHDAHIAEATSFNVAQGCSRTAHPAYPPKQLMEQAWRRNRALDRWLDYLLRHGHSVATMKAAGTPIAQPLASPVTVEIG